MATSRTNCRQLWRNGRPGAIRLGQWLLLIIVASNLACAKASFAAMSRRGLRFQFQAAGTRNLKLLHPSRSTLGRQIDDLAALRQLSLEAGRRQLHTQQVFQLRRLLTRTSTPTVQTPPADSTIPGHGSRSPIPPTGR